MKFMKIYAAALSLVLFAGCASNPIQPKPLTDTFYSDNTGKIGLYFDELPKTDMALPGASCLLCLAAAAAANSSLTKHVKTLPSDELQAIPTNVTAALTQNGMEVVAITQPIDFKKLKKVKAQKSQVYFAPKDMRPLKEQLGVEQLLVIDLNFVGVQRSYSAYVPTGGPQANISGMVTLVNLNDNTYTLYQPINILVPVQGNWDEPPAFPGVTNSYFEALERAKAQIQDMFIKRKA